MLPIRCHLCGLPKFHCLCTEITPASSEALFCLLLHENEWQRETNTGHLITALLPETQLFQWQRKSPEADLLTLLDSDQFSPYLIFPADRPDLKTRAVNKVLDDNRRPLFLIPDGTWKEVRKIVRKSPYLDKLPILTVTPTACSRYNLRRNPDTDHLCTAEIAVELLKLTQIDRAEQLSTLLNRFLYQFQRYKNNHR